MNKRKRTKCIFCKREFDYAVYSSSGKYCSNRCQHDFQFETVTKPKIEAGKVHSSESLKNYLKRIIGNKCEICSLVSWLDKPISLHLDHIDGNSDNCLSANIRLLCPNCHSQTETFCSRNRKNTKRNTYMQRYRLRKLNGAG